MQGRQNAAGYISMLERSSLFTERTRACGKKWILQQDYGAIHTALGTLYYFSANNIRFLDHPPCSPDSNPIENLRG